MTNSRKWYTSQALLSYRSLCAVIHELTLKEVVACLDLEAATQRRRSITDKLISQAVKLNGVNFHQSLQEKYHGKSTQDNRRR